MFKALFQKFPQNVAGIFRNNNWIWHLVMIGVTFLLVESGFDWWYFQHTRIPLLINIAIIAAPMGFFLPVIAPIAMYTMAGGSKNKLQNASLAIAQAGIIATLVTAVYKAFTGRFQPVLIIHPPVSVDISEAFHFGFLRHGIFWGWPSSHTAVAFAMAATLALLYRKNKALVASLLVYAFYIGIAVSMTIHWFSDFVAGAILGTVIAFVVAKSFSVEN